MNNWPMLMLRAKLLLLMIKLTVMNPALRSIQQLLNSRSEMSFWSNCRFACYYAKRLQLFDVICQICDSSRFWVNGLSHFWTYIFISDECWLLPGSRRRDKEETSWCWYQGVNTEQEMVFQVSLFVVMILIPSFLFWSLSNMPIFQLSSVL